MGNEIDSIWAICFSIGVCLLFVNLSVFVLIMQRLFCIPRSSVTVQPYHYFDSEHIQRNSCLSVTFATISVIGIAMEFPLCPPWYRGYFNEFVVITWMIIWC